MRYEVNSAIIPPGSWFLDFEDTDAHKNLTRHRQSERIQRAYSIIIGDQQGVVPTSYYPFNPFFVVTTTPGLLPLSMAAASRPCRRGLPLIYHVWYGWSRHRHRFCYSASDAIGGTLLCRTLLCGTQRRSHQIHQYSSAKWDTVNVFLPIMPDLVLPCIYCRCPCRP